MPTNLSSFTIGQSIGPYKVLDAKHPDLTNSEQKAEAIGRGASAEVCMVQQTLTGGVTINRALKLYSPNAKILTRRREAGLSSGRESFIDEIKAISSFNLSALYLIQQLAILLSGKIKRRQTSFLC